MTEKNRATTRRDQSLKYVLAASACAAALAASTASKTAFAQDAFPPLSDVENTTRQALILAAQTADNNHDYTTAIDRAQKAGAIRWSVSLRAFLAGVMVKANRPADAVLNGDMCVRDLVNEPGESARIPACRALVAQQRPLTATVELSLSGVTDNAPVTVTVNGSAVPPNLVRLGAPISVNPGSVVVEATADHHTPFRWNETVAVTQTVQVKIELPAIESHEPVPPDGGTPPPDGGEVRGSVQPPPPPPPPGLSGAAIGLIAAGAGITAVGGILYLFGGVQNTSTCQIATGGDGKNFTVCTTMDGVNNATMRNTMFTVAPIVAAGGVAVLITGIIVMATARPAPAANAPTAMVDITPTSDGAGALLRVFGAF